MEVLHQYLPFNQVDGRLILQVAAIRDRLDAIAQYRDECHDMTVAATVAHLRKTERLIP